MLRNLLASFSIMLALSAHAQDAAPVIRAERNFAAHAAQHGTRAAFLAFTDSTAVFMDAGQYHNALTLWQQQPDNKIILQWGPQFACGSADGECGFTTGPYYMRFPGADTLLNAGQYTTFWKRNSEGNWKYLIDFGIRYPKQLYAAPPADPVTASVTPDPQATDTMAEETFLQQYREKGAAAYDAVLNEKSWLNLHDFLPVSGADRFRELIRQQPAAPRFTPVGSSISGAKDLAYVYGDAVYEGRKTHYLRIWGHTPAGWKILVQVLQ